MAERQPISKIDLKPGSHVHLMGVCGTAMGSLAGLLRDRGFTVTGSDQNVYPPMSTQLEKLGIKIMEGYRRENLTKHGKPDLVIVGNVISRQYEEAQALLESDIPFTSLPQAMGQLVIAHRHSIVVSGTHGKTTTTSLMSWVTDQLGLESGFMIGGIPKNFDFSYRVPKGDWFVIEGDEYDTAFFDKVPKFIHYRPRSVILTSVEFDHADIYRDLDHVKEAFQLLLKLLPEKGVLVTTAEDANIADLISREKAHLSSGGRRVVTFGMAKGDYQARNVKASGSGTEFDVHREGKPDQHLKMQMIGDYNVKNALAAFALSETLGFDLAKVVRAIETFQGVKRRQEIIGKPNDITIIEDFAHHPTAVKQTIQTIQSRYPKSRVYSVFEARSATSRRSVFQNEYADALGIAHAVVMPQPFNQASIPEDQRFSSDKLIGELKAKGVDASLEADVDGIVATLKRKAKPGDVILIMSNGGFGGIYEKLLTQLK
ncbi:MAG: UDP-N-acetylmuramate:L-alanyl-gamma-D-glutamyl-meso-diaminopimelate ligase [Bdellovibrionota bacterium]